MAENPDPKKSKDFREDMKAAELAARDLARDLKYVLENLKESADVLDKQAKSYKDLSKSSQLLEYFAKRNLAIAKDVTAIYEEEVALNNSLVLKQNMLATGLRGNYAQLLTTYMLENDITNVNDERVQLLAKQLTHRQHHSEQIEKQLQLTEDLAKWQLELNEELEEYEAGWEKVKSKVKAIITDPQVLKSFLAAKGIEAIKEGLEEVGEVFSEIRQEGFGVVTATKELGLALGSTFSLSGASMKENAQIMAGIREEMGNLDGLSKDVVVEVGKLSKTLGISAQEAGKLQGMFQSLPGTTAETATNTLEFAGALATAAHVAPGDVMKSIAGSAEDVALFTKDGGKNIATAAVAAKKLGVEFSTLTKSANALLDFESSINKQMEASVLLGKEINLDKAREAALNGDIVTATQEVLKNIGGEAEYNQMNLLQRKALADSMGVSVQELSKMIKNQDQLNNLTQEQQMALAEGSMTMDEVLGNAGGVADRLWEGTKGIGALVIGASEFSGALKESVSFTKDIVKGFMSGSGILGKLKGGVSGAFGGGAPEMPQPLGGGGGPEDKADKLSKINGAKLLQAAAAMAVAAAGVFIFAKAVQELEKVQDWTNIAIGLGAFLTTLAAAGAIGTFAGAGLTALASGLAAFGVPMVALGVAVLSLLILSIGAGLMMFGIGIGKAAEGMSSLVASLKNVPFENLMALPIAFAGIAAGLYAMAAAGLTAMPVLLALTALGGVSAALGGLGDIGGGEEDSSMRELIDEVKSLKQAMLTPVIVNLDGRKVAEGTRQATNYTSVR